MGNIERMAGNRDKKPAPKETRYEYSNGSRKLYDRRKPPEGCDVTIWHLALFFEDTAESYGESVVGLPILYTELSHRIYTSGIDLIPEWIDIVEHMIEIFWATEQDTEYAINEFCKIDKFDYYKDSVLSSLERSKLVDSATRVLQEDEERRDGIKGDSTAIVTKRYTEEELESKIKDFKDRS